MKIGDKVKLSDRVKNQLASKALDMGKSAERVGKLYNFISRLEGEIVDWIDDKGSWVVSFHSAERTYIMSDNDLILIS